MGDRANVVVKQNGGKGGEIFLYSHWGGSELPTTLQDALKRGHDRWRDEAYLTRIIFSEMVKDNLLEDTGYGISTYLCDNEYDLLVVDSHTQTVTLRAQEGGDKHGWPFEEYVSLDLASGWDALDS